MDESPKCWISSLLSYTFFCSFVADGRLAGPAYASSSLPLPHEKKMIRPFVVWGVDVDVVIAISHVPCALPTFVSTTGGTVFFLLLYKKITCVFFSYQAEI